MTRQDIDSKGYSLEFEDNSIADMYVRLRSVHDDVTDETRYYVEAETEFCPIGLAEYVHYKLTFAPTAYTTFKKALELMMSKEINDKTYNDNGNVWEATELDTAKEWFERVCGFVRDMIGVFIVTHPDGLKYKQIG